jgi:hypothetical protein
MIVQGDVSEGERDSLGREDRRPGKCGNPREGQVEEKIKVNLFKLIL